MGVKTGLGGFDINDKNYSFDSVEPGTSGVAPVDSSSEENNINVDNTQKDLGNTVKLTLGQYLSDLTNVNNYKVDAPTDPPVDTPITTENNVPQPLSIAQHVNSDQFINQFDDEVVNGLNLPVRPSEELKLGISFSPNVNDPAEELLPSKENISKGKAFPQHADGNQILPSVKDDSTQNAAIGSYLTKVLSNNRFSAASRSLTVDNIDSPRKDFNPTIRHPKYGDVTHHKLAQIGLALSTRSSRELTATSDGYNPSSAGAEAATLLPATTQLGLTKVPLENLKTSDVLVSLSDDEISPSQLISITDGINDGSWGALNNIYDKWSGISSIGMIALSVSLVSGVTVVISGLGALIGLIKGNSGPNPSKTAEGRYTLGRYTTTPGVSPNALDSLTQLPVDVPALLGLNPTTFPFGRALEVGTLAFFGIKGTSFNDLASLDALDAAVTTPGWNAIMARTIIRSSTDIIKSVADIGGNPISIAKGIISMIDVLRSSKLIAVLNIFANLGDQILTDDDEDSSSNSSTIEEPLKKSSIDKLDENNIPGAAVAKNRLRNSLKLAWSSNRSPSMYLIPDSTFTLSTVGSTLGGQQTGVGLLGEKSKTRHYVQSDNNRSIDGAKIPYESQDPNVITVKKIEQAIEGEYMPFYFHDLRTNEVISFHAFLTALTDDFTPSWEETDGFGRIDPVRTYKNTRRKISLGFYIVSTSEEDHNEMWVKINKLVTLVYPQFTKGRTLVDAAGQNQFIQPFSQLIGASPIVRLRLGDLIKSNYSKFALARLFGADSKNGMKLNGEEIKFEGGIEKIKQLQKRISDAKFNAGGPELWHAEYSSLTKDDGDGTSNVSLNAQNEPAAAPAFRVKSWEFKYFLFSIVGTQSNGLSTTAVVRPVIPKEEQLLQFWGLDSKKAAGIIKHLKNRYDNDAKPSLKVTQSNYKIPVSMLELSMITKKAIYDEIFADESASMTALTNATGQGFLDAKNNPLVKSFNATKGKGLAGSIDSLGFDYYDQVLWETTNPGSKAPQITRVNITFSPIHDIAPGLDHNGYNRAPVYPVGWFSTN